MPSDPKAFLEKYMYQKAFTVLATVRACCPHTEGKTGIAFDLLAIVRKQVEIDAGGNMSAYMRIPPELRVGTDGFHMLFDAVAERVMVENGFIVGS